MSENKGNCNQDNEEEDPAPKYLSIVAMNIMLALVLGILTDKLMNLIGNALGMNKYNVTDNNDNNDRMIFYVIIIIQVIIVTLVIYIMKKISKYIHHEPLNNYSYDVIFISVYIGSQINFSKLLEIT